MQFREVDFARWRFDLRGHSDIRPLFHNSEKMASDDSKLLREWKDFIEHELGGRVGTRQFSSAKLIHGGKTLQVDRPLVTMMWTIDPKNSLTGGRDFVAFFEDDGICEWSPLHDQEEFCSPEQFEKLQGLLGVHSQAVEQDEHFVKTMTETVFEWMDLRLSKK